MDGISRSELIAILDKYGTIVSIGPNSRNEEIMVFKFHEPLHFSDDGINVFDNGTFCMNPFSIARDCVNNNKLLFTPEFAVFVIHKHNSNAFCATKMREMICNMCEETENDIDYERFFEIKETIFGTKYYVHVNTLDNNENKIKRMMMTRAFFHALSTKGIVSFAQNKLPKMTLDKALGTQYW